MSAMLGGVDSRWLFTGLIALIAVERLGELRRSRRNLRGLVARGGVLVAGDPYRAMVALHAGLLLAAPLEVWLLRRPWVPALAAGMLLVLATTMGLRYWAVRTLGERWTTRVVVVPGETAVSGGPYRFLRHPNYLAVLLEVAALPLVHTAWLTALVASGTNAAVLRARIRVEERALVEHARYAEALAGRPGLLPGWRRG